MKLQESRWPYSFNAKMHVKQEQRKFESLLATTSRFKKVSAWFILTLTIIVSLYMSEQQDIFEIISGLNPMWLICAIVFQASTYYAQSFIWKIGLMISGQKFRVNQLLGLSLAQFYTNQAVPSLSVSGAHLVVKGLSHEGVSRSSVSLMLALSLISYIEASVILFTLGIVAAGAARLLDQYSVMIFLVVGLTCSLVVLKISRRLTSQDFLFFIDSKWPGKFLNIRNYRRIAEFIKFKDIPVSTLAKATALQLFVIALDYSTLLTLMKALGLDPSIRLTFISFVCACLARSVSFLPAGVGVFEGALILSLHLTGVSITESLLTTLLFRVLTYWLALIPGFIMARRVFHHSKRIQHTQIKSYWSYSENQLLQKIDTSPRGLSSSEARNRQLLIGANQIEESKGSNLFEIVWGQIRNPLVLLLLFAAIISLIVGDWTDSLIILLIISAGTSLGAFREREAGLVIKKLKEQLAPKANVIRDGLLKVIAAEELVPGDIITLSAGDVIPADVYILESQDCYVVEASITGESFPVLKKEVPEGLPPDIVFSQRRNSMFLGSHLQTGFAKCVVVNTGPSTLFGVIVESVSKEGPQTDFDRNINAFGIMMVKLMLSIVLCVFVVKSYVHGITIETLMFSVALAVGLSPELLPLILNYDLALGSKRLAEKGLLVRHPKALENLGAINVLCSDKSGTLTRGVADFGGAFNDKGRPEISVLEYAWINSTLQSGMKNPIDAVIAKQLSSISKKTIKIGEIPYDFKRKRLSVAAEIDNERLLITKGAFDKILEICSYTNDGEILNSEKIKKFKLLFETWSNEGARVLGVSWKKIEHFTEVERNLETGMSFLGFLVFKDFPKENVAKALDDFKNLGIEIKIITGDNTLVTQAVARQVGLDPGKLITGKDLNDISDEALPMVARGTQLFTQVDPHQKERIVRAIRKSGFTVAYMGDGINDVSAMHASDASISVDTAVAVAKSTADIVLLEKSLEFVKAGIREGRVTFHNSLKYINITMSANLGNMISMAIASILLPFLPLLAGQILLNNLLSDIPALALAEDNVDSELLARPTKWDLKLIIKYMFVFGLISSFFDLVVFYFLEKYLKVSSEEFRTVWFIESLLTELFILLVLRTMKPLWYSRPSSTMIRMIFGVALFSLLLPYFPGSGVMGFRPLKLHLLLFIFLVTFLYLVTTELTKRWLNSRILRPFR